MDQPTDHTNKRMPAVRSEDEASVRVMSGTAAFVSAEAAPLALPRKSVQSGLGQNSLDGSEPNKKLPKKKSDSKLSQGVLLTQVSCVDAEAKIIAKTVTSRCVADTPRSRELPLKDVPFIIRNGKSAKDFATIGTQNPPKDTRLTKRELLLPKNNSTKTTPMKGAAIASAPSSHDPLASLANMPLHMLSRAQTPPLQLERFTGKNHPLGPNAIPRTEGEDLQRFKISPTLTSPSGHSSQETSATPPSNAEKHKGPSEEPRPRPRLSLSAYRKPEAAVRLTDSDPSRSIHDDYDLRAPDSRVLGHGASSTVRLAVRRSDGVHVAVKAIAKHDVLFSRRGRCRRRKQTLDECEVLGMLSGDPHVVGLLDTYETDDEVQLVLEYCAGGELFDAIHRRRQANKECCGSGYTEVEAAHIIRQLLLALKNMHGHGIVHRDIKPENVLLLSDREDETRVKLTDFGLARALLGSPVAEKCHTATTYDFSSSDSSSSEDSGSEASPCTPPYMCHSRAYSRVGSDYYIAPEVMSGAGYDTAVDVYSLGVTLYILLCGFPPRELGGRDSDVDSWSDDNDEDFTVKFPGSHWMTVSEEAKDLVRRMMEPDPILRITAKKGLEHDWIVQSYKYTKCSIEPRQKEETIMPNLGSCCFGGRMIDSQMRSRKRSRSGDHVRAKRSRSSSVDVKGRGVPSTLPFSRSMAISMADLFNRVSSIASDASATVANLTDVDVGEDEADVLDCGERAGSPFGSIVAPLSV